MWRVINKKEEIITSQGISVARKFFTNCTSLLYMLFISLSSPSEGAAMPDPPIFIIKGGAQGN